jgi:hypothetical protein
MRVSYVEIGLFVYFRVSHGTHIEQLIGATKFEYVIVYDPTKMLPKFCDYWMVVDLGEKLKSKFH